MSECESVKLEEICLMIKSGGTPLTTVKEFYDGDINFLSISDIDGKILNKTKKYITKEGLDNSSSFIVEANQLIYTIYATPAIPIITNIDVAIPQSVIALYLNKDKAVLEYIYYYLEFKRKNILKFSMLGTQANLTAKIVKEIKIKLPNFDTQHKIANLLTSLDDLIEMSDKKVEQLELKKKYYLNKIFDNIDGETVKLKELTTVTASSLSKKDIKLGEYAIYGAEGIVANSDKFISEVKYISIVKDGAGVGRVFRCGEYTGILSTMEAILVNDKNLYDYVYYFLQNLKFNKYITGSTIPHLYYKDYSSAFINKLSLEKSNKIGNFFTSLDDLISIEKKVGEQLRLKKKYYLNKIFSND